MSNWTLIKPAQRPAGTIEATNIEQMYCIVPDVVPFNLSGYTYKVGIEPDIPSFYLSIQNFNFDKILFIEVLAPPFIQVFSNGSNILLQKFLLMPKNNSVKPPTFPQLGPGAGVIPPTIVYPPVFGRTDNVNHGLLVMRVEFSEDNVLNSSDFVLGPTADGSYKLDFSIKPYLVNSPVYVRQDIECPPDVNVLDDGTDIGDDGTGDKPGVTPEEPLVEINIEDGVIVGDIIWIDGTTGITYNATGDTIDPKTGETVYEHRPIPDNWVSIGGMLFPPEASVSTPCIDSLLKVVNKTDVPPIGFKRRGYQIDPWAFLAGGTSEETQNKVIRNITRWTFKCVIADIGEQVNDFTLPANGVPQNFRYDENNPKFRTKMIEWLPALVKLVRLRQFFVDGNSFSEEQASGPINKDYGDLVNKYLPNPSWGAFGVGSKVVDWGDYLEQSDTAGLVEFIQHQLSGISSSSNKSIFTWAFKQVIELLEQGIEIPSGTGIDREAARFSTQVASIIYDIQEKGEGNVPPFPGPYDTEK